MVSGVWPKDIREVKPARMRAPQSRRRWYKPHTTIFMEEMMGCIFCKDTGCEYCKPKEKIRTFKSGATHSPLGDKPQYEGYLNPLVIKRFGEYMLKHQTDSAGNRRQPDNWQQGCGRDSHIDSKHRHDMDLWLHHRGYGYAAEEPLEEALCAIMFNTMGYLLDVLKDKDSPSLAVESKPVQKKTMYCKVCGRCEENYLFPPGECCKLAINIVELPDLYGKIV